MTRATPTGRQGRRYSCQCQCNHRKMTFAVAAVTMVISVATSGILVTDLLNVNRYHESVELMGTLEADNRYYQWYIRRLEEHRNWTARQQGNNTEAKEDIGINILLWELNVTKVLYTALACTFVLLTISSISLIKGTVQGRQSLIATWLMITSCTMLYDGAVLGRDWHMLGIYNWLEVKFGAYLIFVVFEISCVRHVIDSLRVAHMRTVQRARVRSRSAMAVFDPRNPDCTIFSIADRLHGQAASASDLFKLPSYDEATSSTPNEQSTSAQPPPYELEEIHLPPPSYEISAVTRV